MQLAKWTSVGLLTVAFLVIAAGVVLAAPSPSSQANGEARAAPTTTITPTWPLTHPVALAISKYFSLTYTEIISLHQSGMGFGEISRLYMLAEFTDKSADEVLAMRQAGAGWGQIMKELEFKPGGKNLGAIMSGHDPDNKDKGKNNQDKNLPSDKPEGQNSPVQPECPGNSCKAPGHNKSKP